MAASAPRAIHHERGLAKTGLLLLLAVVTGGWTWHRFDLLAAGGDVAGAFAATGAVMLLYLVDIGLRAFTSVQVPFIHESGALGIGFSLLVVGLAAFNLALDFDLIERGIREGAPKYMEWYGAFALMVTLVWLYMEILRLLSKLRR